MNTLRILFSSILLILITCTTTDAVSIDGISIEDLNIITSSQNISITLSPENPSPYSQVTATLNTNNTPSTSEIAWMIDGEILESGNSITFTTGGIGENINLAVVVLQEDQPTLVTKQEIIPSRVTLLKESETYTPPFYKGRAKHSAHSYLRLSAIAEIPDNNSSLHTPNNLIYKWSKNGIVMSENSGLGKSTIHIEGPGFLGTDLITVEVRNKTNSINTSMSTIIESIDPKIILYEKKPLTGVQYLDALQGESTILGPDVELVAEPYFIDATSRNASVLKYQWEVDGKEIPSQENQSELSLTIEGNIPREGTEISVALKYIKNTMQNANTAIMIKINQTLNEAIF